LRQLEDELRRECQLFGPELEVQLVNAEEELERGLTERVRRLLGEEEGIDTRPADKIFGEVNEASAIAATHLGDRVSGNLTNLVTGVVSTSVALVVGTVTGGFGEALGVALLVGVVESGPVGWAIGALGGLIATVGVLTLGRERLQQSVKDVPIPAAALKVALWSSRYNRLIADGRKKCEESVVNSLAVPMNQFSSSIADHLWKRLRAIVGESQRPFSASPTSQRRGEPTLIR
jgi:hypothetical protein